MQVTDAVSFDEYWWNPLFADKKPVRNGSQKMMVGDNIYHRLDTTREWEQADSHHSNPDGTANVHNVRNDTQTDRVLISRHFFYFGRSAPVVPTTILDNMSYRNGRNYRVFHEDQFLELSDWLHGKFGRALNIVIADPYDFEGSARRYSARDNRVSG